MVVVDFFGFEVEIRVVLIDCGLLIILGDLYGSGLAFGADEAGRTLAGDVFIVGGAGSSIKTVTRGLFMMGYGVWVR